MLEVVEAISASQLNQQPNGQFTVTYPLGATTVLSVQPDGTIQTRPQGTAGPYEVCSSDGSKLTYAPLAPKGPVFILPLGSNV